MSFILHTDSVIFHEKGYLTASVFFKEVAHIAAGYQKLGLCETSVCLLKDLPPLDTLKALIALLCLKCTVCLLNPKTAEPILVNLLDTLGPHTPITHLPYSVHKLERLSLDEQKLSILIATSGSSSMPKLIAHTLKNWHVSAEGSLKLLDARSYEPWILSLPLFHVSGLAVVFRAFLSHAPLIISSKPLPIFQARVSMIPYQLKQLQDTRGLEPYLKVSSLLVGGAKLSEALFYKTGHFPLYITYGMSEACSQITCSEKSPLTLHEGKVLHGRMIRIDEEGSILIKGECVADYRWDKGALIPLKDNEGFYHTKDHGTYLENGALYLLGRKDERLEIKGEKIYPLLLEKAFHTVFNFNKLTITHIQDAASNPLIIAFCDPLPSEQAKAFIKQKLGSLYYPYAFFQYPEETPHQKINLKWLKLEAIKAISGENATKNLNPLF